MRQKMAIAAQNPKFKAQYLKNYPFFEKNRKGAKCIFLHEKLIGIFSDFFSMSSMYLFITLKQLGIGKNT